MAFRSPAPHRYSRGNVGATKNKLRSTNKFVPHIGTKQLRKAVRRVVAVLVDSDPWADPDLMDRVAQDDARMRKPS